jgi:hypothetical protein
MEYLRGYCNLCRRWDDPSELSQVEVSVKTGKRHITVKCMDR